MNRTYTKLECDGADHVGNPYSMKVVVIGTTAICACDVCGFHKEVDLNSKRSLAASRRPKSAFFISK